jgi:hypothetical protein
MMEMKETYKNHETEYINEMRKFRKSKMNEQKKKLPNISHTNLDKHIPSHTSKIKRSDEQPKRKYMKKYFLVKRLNPRKKKEKVQENDSEDRYFN